MDIFAYVSQRLTDIERLASLGKKEELSVEDFLLYTGISKGHLDRLTSKKKIPYYKRGGIRFFKKTDIENWLLTSGC